MTPADQTPVTEPPSGAAGPRVGTEDVCVVLAQPLPRHPEPGALEVDGESLPVVMVEADRRRVWVRRVVGVDPAGACGRAVELAGEIRALQRQVDALSAERRALLVAAHGAGWTWDRVAVAVGMNRVSVMRVVRPRSSD